MIHHPSIVPDLGENATCLWSSTDLAASVTCEYTYEPNGDAYAWLTLWLRGLAVGVDRFRTRLTSSCMLPPLDGRPIEWTRVSYSPVLDRRQGGTVDGIWDDEEDLVADVLMDAQEIAATLTRMDRRNLSVLEDDSKRATHIG